MLDGPYAVWLFGEGGSLRGAAAHAEFAIGSPPASVLHAKGAGSVCRLPSHER